MKNAIAAIIYLFFILTSFKNNFIITVFLLLVSVIFPLSLFLIDRLFNKKIDSLGLTKILNFCATLMILISFVYTASTLYLPNININSDYLYAVASRTIYFATSLWIVLISIYYSSNSLAVRNNIIVFVNSIETFIGQNQLIHTLMGVILFITSSQNKELFIGLVGTYVFYFLSEINRTYINDNHKETISTEDIQFIVILCFCLIYFLALVEQMIFCVTNGSKIKNVYSGLAIIGIIVLTLIKYNLNKIKKNIMKKK